MNTLQVTHAGCTLHLWRVNVPMCLLLHLSVEAVKSQSPLSPYQNIVDARRVRKSGGKVSLLTPLVIDLEGLKDLVCVDRELSKVNSRPDYSDRYMRLCAA